MVFLSSDFSADPSDVPLDVPLEEEPDGPAWGESLFELLVLLPRVWFSEGLRMLAMFFKLNSLLRTLDSIVEIKQQGWIEVKLGD